MEEGLEACEAALGVSSSPTSSSGAAGDSAAASSNSSNEQPAEASSASSSASSASNFSALLGAVDLEPVGGVRATGGYLAIENVSEDRSSLKYTSFRRPVLRVLFVLW